MFRENCCMNYPWYCDACDEQWFDSDRKVWLCPYDDVLSEVSLLEADIVYPEKEN